MPDNLMPPVMESAQSMRAMSSRVAFVEERYKNFDSRLKQLQKNVIDHHQELRKKMQDLDKQLLAVRDLIEGLTDRMKAMRGEILLRASKEDLAVLKKYIDMWDPFQFVTAEQVEKMVEEKLQE